MSMYVNGGTHAYYEHITKYWLQTMFVNVLPHIIKYTLSCGHRTVCVCVCVCVCVAPLNGAPDQIQNVMS